MKPNYNSIKDTSVCSHLDFYCLKLKYEVNHDIILFILAPGYSVTSSLRLLIPKLTLVLLNFFLKKNPLDPDQLFFFIDQLVSINNVFHTY